MARPTTEFPTTGELEILRVFWNSKTNACTVRDVHDALSAKRKVSFTTIATMVRIMVGKKQLKLIDERRPQIFSSTVDREKTAKSMQNYIKRHVLA